jgi:pimeloyl-ACP methyl ester carboxylesterase
MQLGKKIKKLAIYEAPYLSGDEASRAWKEYRRKLDELLALGRRGDAVGLFMQFVGTPADQVEGMRSSPMWTMFEAVAPTLAYDAEAMGADRSAPLKRAAKIGVPVLVMNGTGLPFMAVTAKALAKAIPHAEQRTLEGQGHDVDLKVLAPRLMEFFA